jgi:hypothetical protein
MHSQIPRFGEVMEILKRARQQGNWEDFLGLENLVMFSCFQPLKQLLPDLHYFCNGRTEHMAQIMFWDQGQNQLQ